jgi:hypothetical protein
VDILLDVISGVERVLLKGSEDHDSCVSMLVLGAFSTGVFFNTNALPRINIGADV